MTPEVADWQRCGNTPYYRSGKGLNWFFIDPFNYRVITTSNEKVDEYDVVMAVLREAPRYDWPMLKSGIHYISSSSKEDEMAILRVTHEWAHAMVQMKKLFRKDPVTVSIKKSFDNLSMPGKDAVLRGVRALIEGYAIEDLKHIHQKEQVRSRLVISIDAGSGITPDRIRAVESHFTDLSNTVLANNIEEALEAVLADLDIFEC